MSENSNSCSHKSPCPSELVSRCPMGNVVLFPLYIYMFVSNRFGPSREALWFIWLEKCPYLSGAKRDSRREGVEGTGECGHKNRHRDWEREQMGNWRRRWREMKWDRQRHEWKKVCGWGEEKVNTVFVTLQQEGEREERRGESVSLCMALFM